MYLESFWDSRELIKVEADIIHQQCSHLHVRNPEHLVCFFALTFLTSTLPLSPSIPTLGTEAVSSTCYRPVLSLLSFPHPRLFTSKESWTSASWLCLSHLFLSGFCFWSSLLCFHSASPPFILIQPPIILIGYPHWCVCMCVCTCMCAFLMHLAECM